MEQFNLLIEEILRGSPYPFDSTQPEFIGLALKGRLIEGEIKEGENLILKSGNDKVELKVQYFANKRKKVDLATINKSVDVDEIGVNANKTIFLEFSRKNRKVLPRDYVFHKI